MSTTATLRYTPWRDDLKSHLSSSEYATLTAAVTKCLFYTISIPDNNLDVAWARSFVRSYAHDIASHALQAQDEDGTEDIKLSLHELAIRKLTLQLAGRLAKTPGGLDVADLVNLSVAYGAGNTHSLRTIFEDACKSTPSLLEEFKFDVVPGFGTSLQDALSKSSSSARKVAYVLSQLLGCGPSVVMLFAQNKGFFLTLAKCYHTGLNNLATLHGGMKLDALNVAAGWQRDWVYTKTGLIDSFHAIVQALLQSDSVHDRDHLFDILFAILELPSSSASNNASPTPFISQSLLTDYQYTFNLSSILNDKFRGADDARVDLLAATLADLSASPDGTKPAGGLSLLIKDPARARPRGVEPPSSKGKAKAVDQPQELQTNPILDLAISQVLDIFPSHTPQHIRRCLEHPAFDGNAEKLISSLLEGTLPPELADNMETSPQSAPQVEDFKYIKDRRNAWDDDAMDFSKLRIGKTRDDADALLQDRSFIEQMKADIIRRAEELSDEDDTTNKPRGRLVAFEEELDDGIDTLSSQGLKVAGDGEASDDSDGEDDAGDVIGPPISSPETILELTYLDNPKLFDRDGATRRSKTRAELKAKTGWGDEQIEGWRIMLERNSKKDKILQKHEFSGNVPPASNENATEPGPSGSAHGASTQRGRSGDGRGRGGGRGGDGDTARGRAWKDKNKARSANHNRKRGHDKKMARGGGPLA